MADWNIECMPGSLLCDSSNKTAADSAMQIELVISRVVGVLTIIAGLYFFIQIILVGYSWISAGGDKAQIQAAQKKLSSSLIGLIITVTALGITYIIGQILGLPILDFTSSVTSIHS